MIKNNLFNGKPWLVVKGVLILAFLTAIIINPPKDPFNRWLYLVSLIILITGYLVNLYDFKKSNP